MSEHLAFEVFSETYDAILARGGVSAWVKAATFAATKLEIPPDAVQSFASFARVKTSPEHPGEFVIAADGEPALLACWPVPHDLKAAEDLVAMSLERPRFWRLTRQGAAWWCGLNEPAPVDEHGVLHLRQDVRGWMRLFMLGCAWVREPDAHPNPAPRGVAILAPDTIDWTRKGYLRGVEQVEILDAPVTGRLATAIKRRNPTLNGPRGARLIGTESRVVAG